MAENVPSILDQGLNLDALVDQRGLFWDRLVRVFVYAAAGVVAFVFLAMVWQLVRLGAGQLSWSFLTELPQNAGREGGIFSILISTLMILGVCLAASVPLGLASAVLLAQTQRQTLFAILVRRSLDVLAGVPSIVFGLFGNAFFCVYLKMGFSILSGGLTLACMALPILIRTMEMAIRSVPQEVHHASAALGMGPIRTWVTLILPAASGGLAAGLVLGIGRALAETAALIFTSGYVDRMPESVHDSGRALSVHIYDLAMNVPGGEANACATALVLLIILWLLNSLTHRLIGRWLGRRLIYT